MKKIRVRKHKPYPDLNSYDYSWFDREMTEEELYKVNGGQVMSQADQYAMAQAHAQGDQETMDAIVSKYENKDGQNAYIYDESVKLGKSFSGYELITNSCGIAGRESLTVEGSGINCYFDTPIPNCIDNVLSASNNNCWREKI